MHFSEVPFPPRSYVRKLPPSRRKTKESADDAQRLYSRVVVCASGHGVGSTGCAVLATALSRKSGPATNTTNRKVVAGALTRGGVGHGFQRWPCSRSWPTPREPYPAHKD